MNPANIIFLFNEWVYATKAQIGGLFSVATGDVQINVYDCHNFALKLN